LIYENIAGLLMYTVTMYTLCQRVLYYLEKIPCASCF